MKCLTILVGVGLIVVALLTACSAPENSAPRTTVSATEPESTRASDAASDQLVLYYFHRTLRCDECLSMELHTDALVAEQFEDALKTERMRYAVINLDDGDNERYVEQFDLTFSTLVLALENESGAISHWRELDDAWDKSLEEEVFKAYVVEEVTEWLNR